MTAVLGQDQSIMTKPNDPQCRTAPLTIAVLIGSVRPKSNTGKAALVLAEALAATGRVIVDVIDPRALALAVPGVEGQTVIEASLQAMLRARVTASKAVVIITPEYDGSYSAITKIMIECLGYPSVLAGKPVTAFGVASGRIGAVRAIDHLRGVLFNIGALVLPRSPSIAQVHKCFDDAGVCLDAVVAAEIRATAAEVVRYAAALG